MPQSGVKEADGRYLRRMLRHPARLAAIVVGTLIFGVGNQDENAIAAHPCGAPYFTMTLKGHAYVGELATFRYFGPDPIRIDWGDGTANGKRRVVRERLRHRFRRTGNVTVTIVQRGYECCDVNHLS